MKVILLFAFVALVAAEIEYYTTDNDHLDVNAVKGDRMKLQAYLNCFNDVAPCSTLAESYKRNIRESVAQACKRCNPNQKFLFWTFLQALKEMLPEEYWNFKHHYDPENKYFDALEREISKYVKPDMEVVA
uniref:Chemosensory protein 31 n=1 Tax=Heliconius charithonia TaxID=33434 RepID=A0AA49FPN7_HELCH|nr:chemosensory protein 31 [Heliconius charithonia]